MIDIKIFRNISTKKKVRLRQTNTNTSDEVPNCHFVEKSIRTARTTIKQPTNSSVRITTN